MVHNKQSLRGPYSRPLDPMHGAPARIFPFGWEPFFYLFKWHLDGRPLIGLDRLGASWYGHRLTLLLVTVGDVFVGVETDLGREIGVIGCVVSE